MKSKRRTPTIPPRRRVVATTDLRGVHDDRTFYFFRGLARSEVEQAFTYLIGEGRGIARTAIVTEEDDIVRRMGKSNRRVSVELVEPNYHFAGPNDTRTLIEAVVRKIAPCRFRWCGVDEFLNI